MINFTIPVKLLTKVDRLAEKETRSRSELLREATRRYLAYQKQRKEDFSRIRQAAARINLPEDEAFRLAEEAKQWARKKS